MGDELYEFYVFHLYVEQTSADTRLRSHRTVTTPLLLRPVFTENSKSTCFVPPPQTSSTGHGVFWFQGQWWRSKRSPSTSETSLTMWS